MIQAGQTVENPVTRERMTFIATAADTGGEATIFELTGRPDCEVAMAHVHPHQSERFEVIEGIVEVRLGREKILVGPGDVVDIAPGIAHTWKNAGAEDVRFRVEVRPSLGFERMIETMFGLAADGKTTRKGMPNPLRLAVIARHHFDAARLPVVPAWMQRAALALGAPLGRLVGYRATYDGAAAVPAVA